MLALAQSKQDVLRWQETAKRVNIIRDKWGIPHIYGNQMQIVFSDCCMHNVKMIFSGWK